MILIDTTVSAATGSLETFVTVSKMQLLHDTSTLIFDLCFVEMYLILVSEQI